MNWSELTTDEKIIELKKQKLEHYFIAKRLGCSQSKIKRVLRKHRMTSDLFSQIGETDEQENKKK